jgi:RNA polymerase sigma factor (sigma-70 family)
VSLDDDYDEEITALYAKAAERVRRFLTRNGCDPGLAEEITDDAFLAARRRWTHVRGLDEPEGYIFAIARNERHRRQRTHDERARDLHPDPAARQAGQAGDPADLVISQLDLQEEIARAARRLTARERDAVLLRDMAGLSEAAAAQVMGVSTGAVKRYTHDGRRALRLLLDSDQPGPGRNDQP